jgi:hypothetical protein
MGRQMGRQDAPMGAPQSCSEMRSQRRDLPWPTAPDWTRSAPVRSTSTSRRPVPRSSRVARQGLHRPRAYRGLPRLAPTMHWIMHPSGHSDDDPMHGSQARNGQLAYGTQMTYRLDPASSTHRRDRGHLPRRERAVLRTLNRRKSPRPPSLRCSPQSARRIGCWIARRTPIHRTGIPSNSADRDRAQLHVRGRFHDIDQRAPSCPATGVLASSPSGQRRRRAH